MSRLRDDIDQLTACMTTPGMDRGSDGVSESRHRPEIIVLLMGHLPVRAGLWRLPVASLLLPECDSLIVARQEDQTLFLECMGSSIASLDESTLSRLEHLPEDSRIVLVPDSNIDSDVLASVEPDRIALVTGGDQAAIVGAYSQLKNLKIDDELTVELVIAGSEPSEVDATATRLIDAASRHLDRRVSFVGAIGKIEGDTGLVASCAVPDHDGGLAELARRIRRGPVMERSREDDRSNSRVVSSRFEESPMTPASLAQAMIEFESVSNTVPDESHGVEIESDCKRLIPMQPTVKPSREVPVSSGSVPPPTSATSEDSGHEKARSEGDTRKSTMLSSHLPGIHALPVHCPACRMVELATDDSGHLHLLCRVEDMTSLPAVKTWVHDHHHLLQMAMPGIRLGQADSVEIHVLGEDVEALCGLRGSGWHPHLLVRVDGTQENWIQVPLEG
tara:strand:+ start:74951 stop:76291 length:1341 start_codon:yes stop_codon:yes gene_type:complete